MGAERDEVEVVPADLAHRNELARELEAAVLEGRRQEAPLHLRGQPQLVRGALGQSLQALGEVEELVVLPLELGQVLPHAQRVLHPRGQHLLAELSVHEIVGVVHEAGLDVGPAPLVGHHQDRGPAGSARLTERFEDRGQVVGGQAAVEDQKVVRIVGEGHERVRGLGPTQVQMAVESGCQARPPAHHQGAGPPPGRAGSLGSLARPRRLDHAGSTNL
jgi:hypothetical protein